MSPLLSVRGGGCVPESVWWFAWCGSPVVTAVRNAWRVAWHAQFARPKWHKPHAGVLSTATFPHGFPPAECFAEAARPDKRQRGSLGPLRFAYLQNADAGKSNQRVVLAGNDKMAYRGTNFGRFATSKSLSK